MTRCWVKHKLHYCDLLCICCTTSCTTNPQHLDMSRFCGFVVTSPFTTSTCHWITC